MARATWHRLQELPFWLRISSAIPLLLVFALTTEQDVIEADVRRWMAISAEERWRWLPHERARTLQLLYLLAYPHSFRTIFYYRAMHGGALGRLSATVFRRLYRGELKLALDAISIGPGLYVAHGYATGVVWKTVIGANCRLHQKVTIGWDSDGNAPRIGDNVTIYTGAVLFGGITVGDGAVVGANAVVTKDVPPGMVARGVPASYHPRRPETSAT